MYKDSAVNIIYKKGYNEIKNTRTGREKGENDKIDDVIDSVQI